MEPISVAARRGEIIESVHRVHAVAKRDEDLVLHGDPNLETSLRSSAKPLQALPFARFVQDATPEELAIASASHQAEPAQLDAVRRLLERTGSTEEELVCGSQDGRPPGALYHNCSGKHAAMLAVCRSEGWPVEGYHLPDHPLQVHIAGLVAHAAYGYRSRVAQAVDGCGVPCFAVLLLGAAQALARLEAMDGGAKVVGAMRAHPRLVGGEGALDTELMEAQPGWIAKRGAEGLLCAASPEGLGIALKVEDGNGRALRPALGALLERLGVSSHPFGPVATRNSRNEVVGELAVL